MYPSLWNRESNTASTLTNLLFLCHKRKTDKKGNKFYSEMITKTIHCCIDNSLQTKTLSLKCTFVNCVWKLSRVEMTTEASFIIFLWQQLLSILAGVSYFSPFHSRFQEGKITTFSYTCLSTLLSRHAGLFSAIILIHSQRVMQITSREKSNKTEPSCVLKRWKGACISLVRIAQSLCWP